MQDALAAPGGGRCATNQVLYNLGRRGIEWDLLPWLRERRHRGDGLLADRAGRLLRHAALAELAGGAAMTPAQVALAWLLAQDGVIAIPKAGNARASRRTPLRWRIRCRPTICAELDRLFPPPAGPSPLAMI